LPYFITLSPHGFYWFSLEPETGKEITHESSKEALPLLEVSGEWEQIIDRQSRRSLENILPRYIKERRWFAGKDRQILQVRIQEAITLETGGNHSLLLFLNVAYVEGESETYLLPLCFLEKNDAQSVFEQTPQALIARIQVTGAQSNAEGYLLDAVYERRFGATLLDLIRRRPVKGDWGEIEPTATDQLRRWLPKGETPPDPRNMKVEQSNSSLVFGDKMIFKLYRKLEPGRNPDVEMSQFLSERASFPQVPALGGYLELMKNRKTYYTLGILQEMVNSQSDAWKYTLDQLTIFYDRVSTQSILPPELKALPRDPADLAEIKVNDKIREDFGEFFEFMKLLGRRTAELHLTLASSDEESFKPEFFSRMDHRSIYQSLRNRVTSVIDLLRRGEKTLADNAKPLAVKVLADVGRLTHIFEPLITTSIQTQKIRVHGDFHLGQVLYTGSDFRFLDFEGEPARSLEERKMKRTPLKDVAGMIRSFHYAAYTALWGDESQGATRPEDIALLEEWAKFWYRHVSAVYLQAYVERLGTSSLIPQEPKHLKLLLDVYLLDKALYEVGYELKQRPHWVRAPLTGLLELIP
jgi:maltose alpha-D-glucosyltransferase/alpha-amylase